jgi:hypothetical protein
MIMNKPLSSPLPWYRWLNSSRMIRLLESVQDLIVVCLCIGLFSFMVLQLREMVLSLLPPLQFQTVTSDILFLLILVELFRLLLIRVWIPPTFDGIDPEQLMSKRHQFRSDKFRENRSPSS